MPEAHKQAPCAFSFPACLPACLQASLAELLMPEVVRNLLLYASPQSSLLPTLIAQGMATHILVPAAQSVALGPSHSPADSITPAESSSQPPPLPARCSPGTAAAAGQQQLSKLQLRAVSLALKCLEEMRMLYTRQVGCSLPFVVINPPSVGGNAPTCSVWAPSA